MNIVKDLLFTGGNKSLDIARLCALASVIAFWTAIFIVLARKGDFDPVAVGTGCAAIFAGSAGWIFARQAKETDPKATE